MSAVAPKPRVRVTSAGQLRGAVIDGQVVSPTPSSAYMRGNQSPFFFNWNPALRDHREDVRVAYADAAARAIDAMHNSGWIAGAIEQSIASTMGAGLRLAARPDRAALGWSDEVANAWVKNVERRWATWSENPMECDAAGKMSVGQLTEAVYKAYYSHGESLALLPYVKRPFSSKGTKVQLLPPHRLVQDSDIAGRLFQGVACDSYGLPLSYRIRTGAAMYGYTDIRARDGAGRPQVAHLFIGREGQTRGITPLAPALRIVKQYDQLSDATLQAALIQAIFAATIEGEAPTAEILQGLQDENEQGIAGGSVEDLIAAQATWYQNTKIDLGGAGRIAHMFPGTKLEFNRSEHPNSTYESFAKFLLREIARCLGMTFETMTGDYSGATYSSVRMAGSEIWPIILSRRTNIGGRFCQMVYEAWLEEQIEQGVIEFPQGLLGFLAHRPAAVGADWRGPAKPQADDLKTAKAHEVYKRLGIMSDERICSDLGYDWEDEYEQRAREQTMREKLKLPEGDTLVVPVDPVADRLVSEPA